MGCDMGCDVLFAFFTIMFRKMFVPQQPEQYSAGSCQVRMLTQKHANSNNEAIQAIRFRAPLHDSPAMVRVALAEGRPNAIRLHDSPHEERAVVPEQKRIV